MICGKPGLKPRQSDSRAWILNPVLGFELGIEGKGLWGRGTVFLTKWGGQGAGEALRLEKGATLRVLADEVGELVWLHSICLVQPSGSVLRLK